MSLFFHSHSYNIVLFCALLPHLCVADTGNTFDAERHGLRNWAVLSVQPFSVHTQRFAQTCVGTDIQSSIPPCTNNIPLLRHARTGQASFSCDNGSWCESTRTVCPVTYWKYIKPISCMKPCTKPSDP